MNDLRQFKDNSGNTVYSARELHAYLGSERNFTTWFDYQVESCNLTKDKDYSELLTNNVINSGIKRGRGRPAKDYALSLTAILTINARANQTGTVMTKALAQDVAQRKELTILDYAREIVKLADNNKVILEKNQELSQAKELAEHKAEESEKTVERIIEVTNEKLSHHKDQVEFADRVSNDKRLYPIGSVAKLLQLDIGRNDLFEILRNDKILMKSENPVQDNEPYQQYKQYFERKMKERKGISKKTGKPYHIIIYQTLVNARGLIWLSKRYGGKNPDYNISMSITPIQPSSPTQQRMQFRGGL